MLVVWRWGSEERALGIAPQDMLCTCVAEAALTKVGKPAGRTSTVRCLS